MLVKTYPLFPSLRKGRGRKKRGGFAPSLKYLPPLLKGEGDTGGEMRRSTKIEQNRFQFCLLMVNSTVIAKSIATCLHAEVPVRRLSETTCPPSPDDFGRRV